MRLLAKVHERQAVVGLRHTILKAGRDSELFGLDCKCELR